MDQPRNKVDLYTDLDSSKGMEDFKSSGAVLLDVPFFFQKGKWYCSEASATMILDYYGFSEISQEFVNENIAYNFEHMLPELGKYFENCNYAELSLEDLRGEINENDPVMIRLLIDDYRHTVVIVGYKNDSFFVHDPALENYLKVSSSNLLGYWNPTGRLGIVIDN